MKKFFELIGALLLIFIITSCHFWIMVDTTVRARNELTDLQVTVNRLKGDVEAIDLIGVTIGDVFLGSIPAGTTTSEKVIKETGDVDVYINKATAYLGSIKIEFEDIDPMETYISPGQLNTVVFDETTAGVVFSALAKKRSLQ